MGNCIRRESPMEWGGDDWGWPEEDRDFSGEPQRAGDCEKGIAAAITEVKVKISKRQLEELMRKTEAEGAPLARHVVAQLLNAVGREEGDPFEAHHRPWRPALQSIPEVN